MKGWSWVDLIGKYEIFEKIGEGGFGVVYKGCDLFIKCIVVIKICSLEDLGVCECFFFEVCIVGNFYYLNVVMIYDFGFEDEMFFFVQEFFDGEDFDMIIDER